MKQPVSLILGTVLSMALLTPAMAQNKEDEFTDPDPWVQVNRVTHNFNDFADRILVRPVAVAYRKIIPRFARHGIGNVFANLEDVGNAVNNVLQGKVGDGGSDLLRVLINSTVGIGGLIDLASAMGLDQHEEDWGQTFARWHIPNGPYVVIPGLGPASVRDGVARILDGALNPLRYLYPVSHRNLIYTMGVVRDRTDLLNLESVVFGDKYIFYRDAYLQRREYLVNDGEASDPFADDFAR